ncbi:MAG: hypothetical protein IKW20_05445 [Bacteroidales bacterium]|nr:hypothetical protein [Bacteroidales bacterium]
MEYPTLNVKQKSRQMSDAFLGYNHNLRIGDSEFYDMKNMTSDYYPVLAPRGKRGVYIERSYLNGIIAKNDKLCYVQDQKFCVGEDRVDLGLDERPKQLISMGAYVIIMPDKMYVNTNDLSDHGNIEATFVSEEDVKYELCNITGDLYTGAKADTTAPKYPTNGMKWIDTSSTPHTLKKYSEANEMWVAIPTTYIKISSKGIGKKFKQYDGVTIYGVKGEVQGLNGSLALWACEDDFIVVIGILDQVTTQTVADGKITIVRKMPNMDFIIESENRLWGCRYGEDINGNFVNEIYACKLGDFRNWNCFMNLATDSYVASCGTDGHFTGAIAYFGYPLFFKETCFHKVYGNYPSNFQIQTTACRGVQTGSDRSLAIVNETLFYKSRGAVCAYDGSLPVEVSSALGNEQYGNAVAGSHNNKYYISMSDATGKYHLFVYDTAKGMWHKEDNLKAEGFCSVLGELYAIEGDNIITMFGSGEKDSNKVPWMVETGLIGMSMPDMKYISKLLIRMSLEVGSSVDISIQYDSMGDWEQVCQMTSTSLRSFSVPIRPRRCDHFRIRIEGEGEGRIYSITKTIEQGSDVS